MDTPVFSVLIITYNQEKYIARTLDSIISQKHSYPYEIVIGDDCSKDDTRKILCKYHESHPDIIRILFNDKNLGIISNYYNVLDHCNGTYIMQCAGDDYWLEGKVEAQISFMECHPDYGMTYGKARIYNETKQRFMKETFGEKKENFLSMLEGNQVPAASVCFRNNLIKQYVSEIKPLSRNWLMEDYPQWLWLSGKSRICFMDSFFAVYREFDVSGSHFKTFDKRIDFCKSTNEIRSFFSKLFNTPVYISDENEMYMNEYASFLIQEGSFNKSISEGFIKYSKLVNPDSFKHRIIRFLVSNRLTCWIYILYRRHI